MLAKILLYHLHPVIGFNSDASNSHNKTIATTPSIEGLGAVQESE